MAAFKLILEFNQQFLPKKYQIRLPYGNIKFPSAIRRNTLPTELIGASLPSIDSFEIYSYLATANIHIQGTTMSNQLPAAILQTIQPLLDKGCFQLPKHSDPNKKIFYICPLSGGIDSFATALVMRILFPEIPITYVHADTGIEANGTSEALDQFERLTGRKILKLKPKKDMLTMIEDAGNFLPSQRQRSCTQQLTTIPFKKFYDALRERHGEDAVFIQFVGLRYDEPTRSGIDWQSDYIASPYPLQALRLVKKDVNKIVDAAIGFPRYYAQKSRSGCQICIFSRRSEIIAAWHENPQLMTRAANMEGVPADIVKVYNALPKTVSQVTGIARNWMRFYRPSRLGEVSMTYEAKRGTNKVKDNVLDLFGASEARKLYVAVEYEYQSDCYGMCKEPFVYFERIINYSTSLAGLKKSLKHFWLHRIHTLEMNHENEEELRANRQVQILELEIDDFDQEIPKTPEDIYTWQNDRKTLYSIRKTNAVIERVLLTEGFYQELKSTNPSTKKAAEQAVKLLEQDKSYGRIISSMTYNQPSQCELEDDIDITDAPVACIACSR